MTDNALILDAKPSMRTIDSNGYMHVAITPISKACVNPYLGKEIAGSERHGFKPDGIYYGLRDPEELKKAAKTFDGMPLLMNHHKTNAENPAKEYTVGSTGTDAVFEKPYLKNSITVTDAEAIKAIENGEAQEISCAYRFKPDFTSGEYIAEDGSKIHYDFIMRDIEANHVALVPRGRAGSDVRVADSNEFINKATEKERRNLMKFDELIETIMPNATAEDKALALEKLEELSVAEDEDPKKEEPKDEPKKETPEEDEPEDDEDDELTEDDIDELLKDEKLRKAFEAGMLRAKGEKGVAKDSAEEIEKRLTDKFRTINAAAHKVRPMVGEINDPLAFDSAEAIYKFALEKAGKDVKKYPASAYEGMVDMVLASKPTYIATDSALDGEIEEDMGDYMKALKAIGK